MSTFAGELAQRGHRPWISVEIAGFGRRLGATSAALRDAYRFCLELVAGDTAGTLHTDRLVPGLMDIPQSLSESIDVRGGTTDLGQIDLSLLLSAPLADDTHGWALAHPTLDLASPRGPAAGWALLYANFPSGAEWHLAATADPLPVVGQALWCGAETGIVTAVDDPCPVHGASCSRLTVLRGQYGSTAQAHPAASTTPPGDGLVWDHPRTLRGRKVTLRVNFPAPEIEPIGGLLTLLPLSEEKVLFSGVVDDGKIPGPGQMVLTATSILGRLSRSLGRRQWGGTIPGPLLAEVGTRSDPDPANGGFDAFPVEREERDFPYYGPDFTWFNARLADQIVLCSLAGSDDVAINRYGQLGTDQWSGLESEDSVPFHEVLCTSPSPSRVIPPGGTEHSNFYLMNGAVREPTAHPVDIMLALLTSTGDGTNGDWDTLPEQWGAGLPIAEIDVAGFRTLKGETAGVSLPNLVLGWDGKPTPLRAFLEAEILAPLGWFLFQSSSGQISISRIADAYPQASYVTLTEDDVIEGSISIDLALPDTIGAQDWAHDYDWGAGEFRRHSRFVPRETDATIDDASDLVLEVAGLGQGEGGALIGARARQLTYWFGRPIPRIKLAVHLDLLLDLEVGDLILLDGIRWPDPLDPDAASIDRAALIVGRSPVLRGSPRIELELLPLPSERTGLWAPAATAVSWVAGTKKLTVAAHDFSDPDNDPVDAARFLPGDVVSLISATGADRVDVALVVAGVVGNVVEFTAAPSVGGGAYTPVAGDVLTFARWEDSANPPEGAWQAGQRSYVAQADLTTGVLPDPAGTAPYIMGA